MQNYTPNLLKIVAQIDDGRRKQGRRYSTNTLVWMVILGTLLGAKYLVEICELFEHDRKLQKCLSRITGEELKTIPSPTTLSRALKKFSLGSLIDGLWLDSFGETLEEVRIAGDGKVMRGIHDGSKRQILSLVNEHSFPLAQIELETKENEITALMRFLREGKHMFPTKSLFTFDAIQTQVALLRELQLQNYKYFLKVKSNQKELKEHLSYIFNQGENDIYNPLKVSRYHQVEKQHDRHSTWEVITSTDFEPTDLPPGFESVRTIGYIKTTTKTLLHTTLWSKKAYYYR